MLKTLPQFLKERGEEDGLVNELNSRIVNSPMSIFWQSRLVIYTALTLLMSGIGMFLYQNQDFLGKYAILAILLIATFGIFICSYRNYPAFSFLETKPEGTFSDYILLFGAFTFVSFWSYLLFAFPQSSYIILAIGIFKCIILSYCAYYFDHKSILNMAILQLAYLFHLSMFMSTFSFSFDIELLENSLENVIPYSVSLSFILFIFGFVSEKMNLKKHFAFTYFTYTYHILALSLFFANGLILEFRFFLVILLAFIYFKYGYIQKSFFAIVFAFLYGYIAILGISFKLLDALNSDFQELIIMFLMTSSIGLIVLLFSIRKKIKE